MRNRSSRHTRWYAALPSHSQIVTGAIGGEGADNREAPEEQAMQQDAVQPREGVGLGADVCQCQCAAGTWGDAPGWWQ